MQSLNHDFTRPASPQVPYLNPVAGKNILVQTRFDGSIPANKIIHVTDLNSNSHSQANIQVDSSILEESCDAILDSDSEDSSIPSKISINDASNSQLSFISALKKVNSTYHNSVKTENNDPYHMSARFQSSNSADNISPQKELKHLIKEVETSHVNNQDYSSIDSSVIDKLTEDVPRIEIVEEPETVSNFLICYQFICFK